MLEFSGQLDFDKPLDKETYEQLVELTQTPCKSPEYPGKWCEWAPTEDRLHLEWDGGEGEFNNWEAWLIYLVNSVLASKGYKATGRLYWRDDIDFHDFGTILVRDGIWIIPGSFPQEPF